MSEKPESFVIKAVPELKVLDSNNMDQPARWNLANSELHRFAIISTVESFSSYDKL